MNEVNVLFIDDDDITEIIGRLERNLKKAGITLLHEVLNLKQDRFKMASEDEKDTFILNFPAIKEELKQKFFKTRFDLIACDFNFLDKKLNGFKLVKWLKNVSKNEKHPIRHAKFVLYSSEKGKALTDTFSEDDMGDLIRLKLEDFIDRTKVSEDVANILLNAGKEINLTLKLIQEMDKYKDLKFRSVYPKFIDKTLAEVIHEIEQDSVHGIGFQETLIELAISHMIELNN